MKFSFYDKGIKNVVPSQNIDIKDFLELLKKDNSLIENIRRETAKDKRNKLKENLSYVTFAGLFNKRSKKGLKRASGLACFDFDDIKNLGEIKEKLIKNKYTHCLFISPSGLGLKCIVKIPEVKDDEEYKKYWISIARHYGLPENDEASKDVSRACYISLDKQPYFNPNSEVYTNQVEDISIIQPTQTTTTPPDNTRSAKEMKEVIKRIFAGKTKEEVFAEMELFAKWSSSSEAYKEKTYSKALRYAESKKEGGELNGIPGIDFSFNEFLIITYKENGDIKSTKVNVEKLTDYIMGSYTFKTIFQTKTEEIFVYDGGVYLKNGRKIIQTEVEKLLRGNCTNHHVREVEEKIKRLTAIDKEEFDYIPEELICLENGVLNLKTQKLEEHNPKYYFKTKLPIYYNEEADCLGIKKFLQDVLYEEDIPVIEEWFGYCLYKKYFIKKAMILFGEKDTGKTVLLNLLMAFINKKNTAGISLQRISSGDKFALSSLKEKYANVFDDLSSKDLTDQGGFKIATGGGFITAEYKFGDSFQFLNYAKHIFATNKIPPVEDSEDDAYYDRWIPIPFDNQFRKKDQDKFLINRLTTKEELSGLLNYALEGLKRLLRNGHFSYNKDSREIKKIMERHSDSLAAFVQDVLIEKPGHKISKDDMYNIYSIYVKEKKLSRLSKSQLGRRLPKYCPYILAKIDKIRFWENADISNLHINFNTINVSQKTITANTILGKEQYSDYIYKNSANALKALNKDANKKPEDFKSEPVSPKLNVIIKPQKAFQK